VIARSDTTPDLLRLGASAYTALGNALDRSGRPAEAAAAWTSAVATIEAAARESGATELLAELATALLRLDRAAEAAPITDTLLARGFAEPEFVALLRTNGLAEPAR
jgi:hypothetical protein